MKTLRLLLFILLITMLPGRMNAELLQSILEGQYNAKSLSEDQMQHLLGDTLCGRYTIEWENRNSLYRHSFVADYYVVDTQRETRTLIGGGQIHDVVLSPNGRYLAFAKGHNLYLRKLDFGTEVAITTDTDDRIFNGTADWVYEEEFGQTCLFAFSPDSKQLAYVRLDDSQVPLYYYTQSLAAGYPQLDSIRYPRPGESNPRAQLMVYDIQYKSIRPMPLSIDDDTYIPRIRWNQGVASQNLQGQSTTEYALLALTLNRDQNLMQLFEINPKSTMAHLLYREKSDCYFLDYELFDRWQWLSDNRMIVLSEKNGWASLYLYSAQGIEQRQLTPNGIDVTDVYAVNELSGQLFYQAAPTPESRQCYSVNIRNGQITQLTKGGGTHRLWVSSDKTRAIWQYEAVELPSRYTLCSLTGAKLRSERVVLDNDSVAAEWKALGLNEEQFFSFSTERGDQLHGWMIYPSSFDASKKYPVVLLQYSGPQSQRVLNRWRKRWEYYLSSVGYLVVCVDTRGTGARGRQWRNASYMQLGQVEAEDLISTASYLQTLPYVDPSHLALCGWSYGGYQTLMTMSQPNSPFCCGIAIAPVTDWRLYDSAYTERFMRRLQTNVDGYTASDVCARAKDLKGRLLIVHGLGDDNVHPQHTMRYLEALNQAGKAYDMFLVPDDNHYLRQRNNSLQMHTKLLEFLSKNNH